MVSLCHLQPRNTVVTALSRCVEAVTIAVLLSLTAGCTTPIGAEQASTTQVYRQLKLTRPASTLHSDSLAAAVLRRYKLEDRFRRAPGETLQILHDTVLHEPRRDLILGLSEL